MDLQRKMWPELMGGMTKSSHIQLLPLIPTHGGLLLTINTVKEKLNQIKSVNPEERQIIIFNAGLHDVKKLCGKSWSSLRKTEMNITDDNFSCIDLYRSCFQELVDVVGAYDAQLKIFRTTTAGWHKYGNFGFAWPADTPQTLPFSTHMVYQFNQVALDVVKRSQFDVHVLDGYWLSLARPDHTEVTRENVIGQHLVHYGPEVIGVMNRQLLMLILHDTCPQTLEAWPSAERS